MAVFPAVCGLRPALHLLTPEECVSYRQWLPLRFFAAWFETRLTEAAASDSAQPIRLALISEGLQTWPLYVATEKRLFGTINDFYLLYPGSIAATRRAWARCNEKQLIAFIRGFSAGYAWLRDPGNKAEALRLLPARLNISAEAATKAYDRYATRPRPQLSSEGLRQVIDVVWDAEGFKPPQGAPGDYLDLSYQQRAESAQ